MIGEMYVLSHFVPCFFPEVSFGDLPYYWVAPLPCCCTQTFRHHSCFEHGGVLLNVEPCHPLNNRTVDFFFPV